jgi:polyphenol oxidase
LKDRRCDWSIRQSSIVNSSIRQFVNSSMGQSYMTLPPVAAAFDWTTEPWGAALRCRPLAAIAPHLFTTRHLELTSAGYQQLARRLGADRVVTVTQVHRAEVAVIRGDTAADEGTRPEADALVSDDPRAAIAVRAADCVPLLMADRMRGVVAAVHAGWRGTAAGAAVAALGALGREFGTGPSDVVVAIGPSIGSCCYEVGSELVDAFAAAGHERHLIDRWFTSRPASTSRFRSVAPGSLHLDVAGANRDQLVLAGVPEEQIHVSGLCTAMHLDVLTSYRAEKEKAGRIAGVIRAAAR